MECKVIQTLLGHRERDAHIETMLRLDGIGKIKEDKNAVYCAIPLTSVTAEQRAFIGGEHDKIKESIVKAGLKIYDPKDSGTNPWIKLSGTPQEVYDIDTIQVVTPRFFEFTHVNPSTGAGIEQHKAKTFVKIPVVINKSGIYTSRMSNGMRRIILLEYEDAKEQGEQIADVFRTLQKYEPAIGKCEVHGNALLGFAEKDGYVCLPGVIEKKFPKLKYNFDKYLK